MSDGAERGLPLDAVVSDDCALLVPIRLQALPVPAQNDPDSFWADLTPQYRELRGNLGYELRQPDLFRQPSERPRAAGIHLHWALPTAFTHVEQKPGEAVTFPPVPDRWLVLRLWEEPAGELRYRAQIVESDYLAPDGTNPWLTLTATPWLTLTPGLRVFRAGDRIGRAVDLAGYAEHRSPSPLTAVAPGNLAFASFYPSCRNVFGFHDDKVGPGPSISSYVVVGWFADPAKDPFAGCGGRADWLARIGKLGWSVPDNTKALPRRVLCHGAIQAVSWPPGSGDLVGDLPTFEVAVGAGAIDAIAALVNQRTGARADLGPARDRLLERLQFALLQERPPTAEELHSDAFVQRRRLTPLRASLHEKTFTALPGGTRWEIDAPARNGSQSAQQYRPVPKLTPDLARRLGQINEDQRTYDAKERELAGLQREIYFQWHKKRLLTLGRIRLDPNVRAGRISSLDQRIKDAEPKVAALRNELQQGKGQIEQTAKDIRAAFDADSAWKGHVLISRPMPRYWRATDPSLAIAGVPIPAIQAGKTPLMCRVTGQTVSSFSPSRQVADVGVFDVQVDDLKSLGAVGELASRLPARIPPGVAELLCEALLLDRERLQVLARIVIAKTRASIGTDVLAGRVRGVLESLSRGDFMVGTTPARRADERAASIALDAALSAVASPPWPWKPVFMIWEARYFPARADPAQNVLEPWRLDQDGVDYVWRDPPPPARDQAEPTAYLRCQGYAPLSDSVGRGLASEVPRPAETRFIFDLLPQGSLVVQSLGGFTEALLMQDGALQLPPLVENSGVIDEAMRGLVGDQYALAPILEQLNSGKFFPIRGGHLVLDRLWLVDTFGRARRVIDPRNPAAPSITASRNLASGSPPQIRLAPRLAQPSRLLFRWLSAEKDAQEFLGDIATEPICGWVMHNRLDRSLLVYNAAGQPLGAVQSVVRSDGRGIRWSKLPLAPIDAGGAAATAARPTDGDIPNRHLRGFVDGLLRLADATGRSTDAAFDDFLGLIAGIEDTQPRRAEPQALSVLVGRPLALVRASLRLDLLGPPAADQSWAQLAGTERANFTAVSFDVRLGDRRKGPDGLIGYFRSDDYRIFHLAQDLASSAGGGHAYFSAERAVSVAGSPDAKAELLTLLLDPRFGIHIGSGILPTKVIDLPADLVSDAAARLEVPFLVAPVLGERQADAVPNIPLPSGMAGSWFWTWRPAPNAAVMKPVEIKSDTSPARSLFNTMAVYEGWLTLR
jgi:hypothetical protein